MVSGANCAEENDPAADSYQRTLWFVNDDVCRSGLRNACRQNRGEEMFSETVLCAENVIECFSGNGNGIGRAGMPAAVIYGEIYELLYGPGYLFIMVAYGRISGLMKSLPPDFLY